MTVAELIAALQKEDPTAQVVMSRDAEGNCYSPVASVNDGMYVPETTWSGTFYGLEEGYVPIGKPQTAVSLWPVN